MIFDYKGLFRRLRMKTKTLVFLLALLTVSITFSSQKLLVYLSGPQKMAVQIEKAFEEENGDVLDVFHTGSGPLRQKIWTEMIAGRIQADVIWGSEPMMYKALKSKGRLMQYFPEVYDKLKPQYRYGEGFFTPVNARYGTIVYNSKQVAREMTPDDWGDLASNYWHSNLTLADASQSSMAFALLSCLYDLNDSWALVEQLEKNNILLAKQNIEAISKVQRGEALACIAPHDGVLRLRKKELKRGVESTLKIAWPASGAFAIERPVAIINKEMDSKRLSLAKAFVDFTLSKRCQTIASQFGFISVRRDIAPPKGVPEDVKSIPFDFNTASEKEAFLRDGFYSIFF